MRLARQVIWNKNFDGPRFTNPMEGLKHGWHTWPTTTTQILTLDPGHFDSLFSQGIEYASSPPPQGSIVLDGERWTVYMPGYFDSQIVSWNGMSAQGKEFIAWAEKMADFFKGVFNTELE
jgi:hypothetical protein